VRLRKMEEWRKRNGVEDGIGGGAGGDSERTEGGWKWSRRGKKIEGGKVRREEKIEIS